MKHEGCSREARDTVKPLKSDYLSDTPCQLNQFFQSKYHRGNLLYPKARLNCGLKEFFLMSFFDSRPFTDDDRRPLKMKKKNGTSGLSSEYLNYQQVQAVLACHLVRLDLKKKKQNKTKLHVWKTNLLLTVIPLRLSDGKFKSFSFLSLPYKINGKQLITYS